MIELSLFSSILHGSLRPWKLDKSNTKYYSKMVSNSSFSSLKGGVTQFEKELNEIAHEHKFNISKAENFQFYFDNAQQDSLAEIDLPLIILVEIQPTNVIARFFYYLIKNEATRLTNTLFQVLTKDMDESHKKALPYHFHTRIVDLLKDIPKTQVLIEPTDTLSIFVIETLKLQTIRLLLETEHLYEHLLEQEISDKYQIFGDYLNQDIPEDIFYKKSDKLSHFQDLIKFGEKEDNFKFPKSDRVSFGYKGDKKKLDSVLKQLQFQINLLNEDKTKVEQLLEILTSPNLALGTPLVYINCETTQFSHMVSKLEQHFISFNPTEIGNTKLFYSKKGNLIKRQNLYKNLIDEPKKMEEIDNIIKHL
ncbi:hypothetical protein EMA8858_00339 [Emticicia aquatica]|uniref:Uncharacterized protein n=1 Tax=Emticicia aquatica TaxID=1681835 RepID=A0ABM9AKK4_9BACT|nr:DUF6617 family protein [Emticicia aquatica]CAH0994230.1 hypothetical protein EMA8858_00339 [Emticicia aquatica]